jgi:hypothetical protein
LAAIIPSCISLNLSAICRNGLNNIPINMVYENKSQKCSKVSPFIILIPPKSTIKPSVKDEIISAIGKKMELYKWFYPLFLCLSFISFRTFSNSIFLLKVEQSSCP